MVNIQTIYGDGWGMAYYCYTHIISCSNDEGVIYCYTQNLMLYSNLLLYPHYLMFSITELGQNSQFRLSILHLAIHHVAGQMWQLTQPQNRKYNEINLFLSYSW